MMHLNPRAIVGSCRSVSRAFCSVAAVDTLVCHHCALFAQYVSTVLYVRVIAHACYQRYRFATRPGDFIQIMRACNAALSGSAALAFLLDAMERITNYDLFVPSLHFDVMLHPIYRTPPVQM